jgi:hypothetical protein
MGPPDMQRVIDHPRGGREYRYLSFLEQLQTQGHIESKVFSVWLNDAEKTRGTTPCDVRLIE